MKLLRLLLRKDGLAMTGKNKSGSKWKRDKDWMMQIIKFIIVLFLLVVPFLSASCSTEPATTISSETKTTTSKTTATAEKPATSQTPVQTAVSTPILTSNDNASVMDTPAETWGTVSVKIKDQAGDIFDKNGKPVQDQAYMDIISAEVYKEDSEYVLVLKLSGQIPERTPDSQIFFEWTIYIDADDSPASGSSWPLVANNLKFEYMARLSLLDSNYKAGLFDFNTGKSVKTKYEISNDALKLYFPESIIRSDTFSFSLAVKKYGERGASSGFMLTDKAPNEGYYNFPDGHVPPPKPGLPTDSIKTLNATVFFNTGNDKAATTYGEAFEYAYTAIGNILGAYPKEKFLVYVYLTQEDLVQGLQTFSGFSPKNAAYFKSGGSPRPVSYTLHVIPGADWHRIAYEYTHVILEEISGNAYESAKWLDEGLAEYLAYTVTIDTFYGEKEIQWGKSRINTVKQALNQDKLFSLDSISTSNQWASQTNMTDYDLQYAQAYAVVTFLAERYGLESCISILKFINGGDSQQTAVQKALSISVPQLEKDFKDWLQNK